MPSFVIDEIYVGDVVQGELVLRDVGYEPTVQEPSMPEPCPPCPDMSIPFNDSQRGYGTSDRLLPPQVPPPICTADVRQCPDGSYVSRTGPMCEFRPCP